MIWRAAWTVLREEFPSLHLLLLGAIDSRDPIPADAYRLLRSDARVHLAGFVADPALYYAAMDLLVLPSLHEGFPACLIEAAAMQLPSVASNVPGNVDAVVDGITGTLVPVRDVALLTGAIQRYLENPELRRAHGLAGRRCACEIFRPKSSSKPFIRNICTCCANERCRCPPLWNSQPDRR